MELDEIDLKLVIGYIYLYTLVVGMTLDDIFVTAKVIGDTTMVNFLTRYRIVK